LSEPKWSDFNGSIYKEDGVKRRFGIFLLLKHKIKDNADVKTAFKLCSILGKTDKYGTEEYQTQKKDLLDGSAVSQTPSHMWPAT
jgi:hypothetical protein